MLVAGSTIGEKLESSWQLTGVGDIDGLGRPLDRNIFGIGNADSRPLETNYLIKEENGELSLSYFQYGCRGNNFSARTRRIQAFFICEASFFQSIGLAFKTKTIFAAGPERSNDFGTSPISVFKNLVKESSALEISEKIKVVLINRGPSLQKQEIFLLSLVLQHRL